MQLSDLIGGDDLARFRDLRWQGYARRAADLLRRRFPRVVSGLDDDALHGAIRDAASEAQEAGFRTERDLMSFLIARVMLGRRFRTNPLYLDVLHAAGWIDDLGRPARPVAFDPLFQQIAAWDALRAEDLASTRRLVARFADLCQTHAPVGVAALHHVLPRCSAAIRPVVLDRFSDAAQSHAQAAGLRGGAASAYGGAAMLLGLGCDADPFHPGIARALSAAPAEPEQRALAFATALRQILRTRLGRTDAHAP